MGIPTLKLLAICTALVLCQGAFAQGNSRRDGNNNCRNGKGDCGQERGDFRQGRPDQGPQHRDNRRDDYGRDSRDERGAGPNHDFRRGGRLPPEYRSRQYVVDDWRAHRLQPPPRGYHWVQTGGDYVLVAIATGVILQFILGGYN